MHKCDSLYISSSKIQGDTPISPTLLFYWKGFLRLDLLMTHREREIANCINGRTKGKVENQKKGHERII